MAVDVQSSVAYEGPSERAAASQRVWLMQKECRAFDAHLASMQTATLGFERATEHFFARLEPVLRAPLPRVWTQVEGGLAEPIRAPISHDFAHTVGGDAAPGAISDAARDLRESLARDVMSPIDAWREALREAEARLPGVMRARAAAARRRARLEAALRWFEARERRARARDEEELVTVAGERGGGHGGAAAGGAHRHHRGGGAGFLRQCFTGPFGADEGYEGDEGYAGAGGGALDADVAAEVRAEEAGLVASRHRRKYEAALADFREAERLAGGTLAGLAVDAAWAKSYAAATLVVAKEALQVATVALGRTKQPLPSFTRRAPAGVPRGALADNLHLAAALPEGFEPGRMRPTAAEPAGVLLPEHVRAHRATAAPLETHARPDVTGLERVATPPAGAAAVPLAEVEGPFARGQAAPPQTQVAMQPQPPMMQPTSPPAAEAAPRRSPALMAPAAAADEEERTMTAPTPAPPAPPPARRLERDLRERSLHERGARAETEEEGKVCGREYYTQVEDRPIVKERVERIIEHRPVEKTFVTETRFVGERAAAGGAGETVVGPAVERVVEAAAPGPACPAVLPTASGGSAHFKKAKASGEAMGEAVAGEVA